MPADEKYNLFPDIDYPCSPQQVLVLQVAFAEQTGVSVARALFFSRTHILVILSKPHIFPFLSRVKLFITESRRYQILFASPRFKRHNYRKRPVYDFHQVVLLRPAPRFGRLSSEFYLPRSCPDPIRSLFHLAGFPLLRGYRIYRDNYLLGHLCQPSSLDAFRLARRRQRNAACPRTDQARVRRAEISNCARIAPTAQNIPDRQRRWRFYANGILH